MESVRSPSKSPRSRYTEGKLEFLRPGLESFARWWQWRGCHCAPLAGARLSPKASWVIWLHNFSQMNKDKTFVKFLSKLHGTQRDFPGGWIAFPAHVAERCLSTIKRLRPARLFPCQAAWSSGIQMWGPSQGRLTWGYKVLNFWILSSWFYGIHALQVM